MAEQEIIHCCSNCSHCDVLDWYCYHHYKDVDPMDDCEQWNEEQGEGGIT